MIKHLYYEDALAQARERAGKREISDAAALALTAAWYAPNVPAMVAVATQAWSPESLSDPDWPSKVGRADEEESESRGEAFRDDLYRTFKDEDQREDSEPMIVWSALGTWSMNGGDND